MWQDLGDVLIVENIDLLVFSKCVVEDIHDDTLVIHHVQGIDS